MHRTLVGEKLQGVDDPTVPFGKIPGRRATNVEDKEVRLLAFRNRERSKIHPLHDAKDEYPDFSELSLRGPHRGTGISVCIPRVVESIATIFSLIPTTVAIRISVAISVSVSTTVSTTVGISVAISVSTSVSTSIPTTVPTPARFALTSPPSAVISIPAIPVTVARSTLFTTTRARDAIRSLRNDYRSSPNSVDLTGLEPLDLEVTFLGVEELTGFCDRLLAIFADEFMGLVLQIEHVISPNSAE